MFAESVLFQRRVPSGDVGAIFAFQPLYVAGSAVQLRDVLIQPTPRLGLVVAVFALEPRNVFRFGVLELVVSQTRFRLGLVRAMFTVIPFDFVI